MITLFQNLDAFFSEFTFLLHTSLSTHFLILVTQKVKQKKSDLGGCDTKLALLQAKNNKKVEHTKVGSILSCNTDTPVKHSMMITWCGLFTN
jgi:hypothetical protein